MTSTRIVSYPRGTRVAFRYPHTLDGVTSGTVVRRIPASVDGLAPVHVVRRDDTGDTVIVSGESLTYAEGVHIITNSVPREVIDAYELTTVERAEFDYLDWSAIDAGEDSASFVRYAGELHDLGEFSSFYGITRDAGLPTEFAGWHGYRSDTFFSGMLVRYTDEQCESVVVARFFS